MRRDGRTARNADKTTGGDAAAEGTAAGKAHLRLLADVVAGEKARIARAGRIAALADLLWITQAYLLALAIAGLATGDMQAMAGASAQSLFALPAVAASLIALIAILRLMLTLLASRLATAAAERVKTDLRDRLLRVLAAAAPSAALPGAGAVAAAIADQVEAIGPYVRRFLPLRPRLTLVPLGILLAAFIANWMVAVILLVAGPLIPVFMALIGMRAKAAADGQHGELARMSAFLLDRLRGLDTLRLIGALERTDKAVAEAGDRFRVATMKVLKIAFLSSTVLELFSALGIAFVAVYVGFSLLGQVSGGTWGTPMDLFTGLFVLLLAPEFFSPLRAFAAAYHDKANAEAAAKVLLELPLAASATPVAAVTAAASLPTASPALTFRDLTLCPGGRAVISRLNLELPAGHRLLVAGPSGAGKSTLIDALTGLRPVDGGAILIDGRDLAELNLPQWRSRLAFLSQEPRLFFGSVRSNLARAERDASEAEMWAALELAGARALVEQMPMGLATRLGEDGFGLSVGEARRIALARAALRREPLLLIADEPTAGLDDETAAVVIAGLERLSAGRTSIIASHDPNVLALSGLRLDIAQQPQRETEGVA
ncbi:thiol reductant ABC exporter subunit CydD [Pannonibacter carbonis]|uniref:thiol reductant ABC exporter subunit CydD n=1 Tax=Pannonibacter carbonis TaxID=2067569 RepID=UPI000D106F13|nr:thiol reductant ABC exporter subunit CydD [Pannonibacter carbonis]